MALTREISPFGIKVTVLGPGGIRTEWAATSMGIPPISEPYQQSVGAMVEHPRSRPGREPTIPSKIGQIILKLLNEEEPPLRLVIGPDAVPYAKPVGEALGASDEKWRELSLSSA
jgi:NAD(P)-dependent dehydrogenase (short-subunit alcohol dehydrogenase family)